MLTNRLAALIVDHLPPSRGPLGAADRDTTRALRDRLFREQRNTATVLYVALAMTLTVFLVMLYLLAVNVGTPGTFYGIAAASGLSITGLIWMVIRIAREMSQAGLLLILIERLPPEDALEALRAILSGQQPVTPTLNEPGLEKKT